MKKLFLFLVLSLIFINMNALVNANSDISNLSIELSPQKITANMGETITFTGNVTNNGKGIVNGVRVYLSELRVTDGKEMTMSPEDWNVFDVAKIDNLSPKESTSYNWGMLLIDSGDYRVYLTMVDKKTNTAVISKMSELTVNRAQKLNPNNVIPIAIGIPLIILILLWAVRYLHERKKMSCKVSVR